MSEFVIDRQKASPLSQHGQDGTRLDQHPQMGRDSVPELGHEASQKTSTLASKTTSRHGKRGYAGIV